MSRLSHIRNFAILIVVGLIGGYWYLSTPDTAKLDISAMQGAVPKVTEIRPEGFPTVQIAKVVRWAEGAAPTPSKGLLIKPFAKNLDHPRWLHLLPNGDVLVAESTQPAREPSGLMDRLATKMMKQANGSDVSANRITLLRDTNGDGVAETRTALLEGLNSPFGMALVGDRLFVANTDSVMAYPFKVGDTQISAKGEKIMDLPANAPNNHWARNLIYDPKENMLYVTIGSNSNIAEGGLEAEKDRAQIKQFDLKAGKSVIYAYGLRNPNGLAYNPVTGTLWTTVNERDQLGSDGPPDYLTTVDFGTFYGWPFFFWGKNEDQRVPQMRPDLKQYSKRPDYALGPHVAALGLAFSPGKAMGDAFANGAFVAEHGSWNRAPKSGYKVVFVPFNERGFPAADAKPVDVVTGFLSKDEKDAFGRPAGLTFDKSGALLIADDAGNTVWRLSAR
jgi:glucose/arabinose dehydrogenase